MVENPGENQNKERVVNFGLLIQKTFSPTGIEVTVEAQNQGIADPEVILIAEAWLDTVKKNFKSQITDGMVFGGRPKDHDEK